MKPANIRRNAELNDLAKNIQWMTSAGNDPVNIITHIHLETDRILNGEPSNQSQFKTFLNVYVSKQIRRCAIELRKIVKSDTPVIANHAVNHDETLISESIQRIMELLRIRPRIRSHRDPVSVDTRYHAK